MKRYVPRVTSNPLKLAVKLLTNGNPAARSALFFAAGGMLLSPLDRLLQRQEQKIYHSDSAPSPKVILVCGPPRSGTTLVAQYLIDSLQASHINNLSSLFPLSPVFVNRSLKAHVQYRPGNYKAFYGRTKGLVGVNDGLHLWDKWLGEQRDEIPEALMPDAGTSIDQFFSAWQKEFGKPTVNKVNRLISCLDLVAPELPNSIFIYLQRDPVMLAQSLLIARSEIVGDPHRSYGLMHQNRCLTDPIEDVCRQVEFFTQIKDKHKSGPFSNRIVFLNYEDFCKKPFRLLETLESILPFPVKLRGVPDKALSFNVSDKPRLPDAQMKQIRQRLA